MSHYNNKANNACQIGEFFIGNMRFLNGNPVENYPTLQSIRYGNQAYDIHGNELDPTYARPMFIGASELKAYDAIKQEQVMNIRGS